MKNSKSSNSTQIDAKNDSPSLPSLQKRHLKLSLRDIRNYLSGRVTPARMVNDLSIADLMPSLSGTIIEIGATKDGNHKHFSSPNNSYILSNISKEDGYLYLDAMDMSIPDNSVDNFVSIASLEHMPDPWKAIDEIHRTLKPGGRLLLVVPFMFPFHAAPSDFFRFSDKALAVMLKKFRVIHAEAMGDIFSTIALFLQRPFGWSKGSIRHNNRLTRTIRLITEKLVTVSCRIIGQVFYLLSLTIRNPDDYAFLYCFLVEKKQ